MNEDLAFLLSHRSRGALADANLLLVYVVGKSRRENLSRLHHTKQYERDFELIERLVEFFPKIYTTPNVMTEVSNLGKTLGGGFFEQLNKVISVVEEKYCVSREAMANERFRKLGLTDAGLVALAAKILIVTADWALYQILRKQGLEAVNFNHLRPLGWQSLIPVRKI